jgi:inner membrane protein
MDPVTHTLCGVALGNALFRRRAGPAAVPILALASNLPDLDAVVHLSFSPTAVLMRRTFGHSIFLVPLWSLALAWILGRRYRHLRLGRLFGMVLTGAAVHLFFDLINSFGVVLLWPLSPARPELAWVFILDLVLTGLLLLPLLIAAAPRMRPRIGALSRAALVAVAAYLAFCGWSRAEAVRLLERQVAGAGSATAGAVTAGSATPGAATASAEPPFSYVFPEPLGPQRWRGVVRDGDRYDLFLVRPMSGVVEPRGSVQSEFDDPLVRAARATPFGRRLDRFLKAPVWQVRRDAAPGSQVVAWDLRFKSLIVDRGPVFEFVVPVTPAR